MDIGPANGTLTLRTAVAGAAARMGHNLVIVIDQWSAEVDVDGADPTAICVRADLRSLRVESGSGGIKPLGEGDRRTIRDNALRSLRTDRHPEVVFTSQEVTRTRTALHVTGSLTIHGQTRPLSAVVELLESGERLTARCAVPVRQSAFGVAPYSTMLGQLKVADEVEVHLEVTLELP